LHLPFFGKPKSNTNYYSFYFQKELQPCIGNMHASLRRSHTQDLQCTCSIYLRDFRYPKDDASICWHVLCLNTVDERLIIYIQSIDHQTPGELNENELSYAASIDSLIPVFFGRGMRVFQDKCLHRRVHR